MGNVLSAGRINEVGDRIETRQLADAAQVDGAQVGSLADFDRSKAFVQAEGEGAVEGCHAQGLARREGGGVAAGPFGEKRRQTHFLKEVEAIVAGRPVGAQADVDPRRQQGGNGGDAAGELEVGGRAMGDGTPLAGEEGDFVRVEMNGMDADQVRAEQVEALQAGQGAAAVGGLAAGDFVPGFVDMAVDRELELFRQGQHPGKGGVTHGVGGVGGEAEAYQGVIEPGFAGGEALVQVIVGIAGVGGGEFQGRDAEYGAHSQGRGGFGGGGGEEIHVVEGGDAPQKHFATGEPRAVAHEIFRNVGRFGGPDVPLQPVHERQVVGEAAHEGHGGVGVQVDEAGNEKMVGQRHVFRRPVAGAGRAGRQNVDNSAVADGHGVPREQGLRLDLGDPAGFDEEIDVLGHDLRMS